MLILLLEPNYKNKYPPIGLMKIAQYHRGRGDTVVFSKGEITPLSKESEKRILESKFYMEYYDEDIRRVLKHQFIVVNATN